MAQVILRGHAQVDFMPSAATGVFFVAALFASGWQFGLAGILGVATSTATAYVLGVDRRNRIEPGLEGFNGCLTAVGIVFFLGRNQASTWLFAFAASIAVAVVTHAVVTFLGTWNIPTFTLPFCIVATVVTIAAPDVHRVWGDRPSLAELPKPAGMDTPYMWTDIWHGFFADISQVFFRPQWYVGLLFLAGLAVASRLAAAMACLGSIIGILTAWVLGVSPALVEQGLMGFNSVLVAIALCGALIRPNGWSVAYAIGGAVAAAVVTLMLTSFFTPVAGHAFTWPFVLTTLFFVGATPSFPHLRRA